MNKFEQTLSKTREYLDYIERHYNNVQKAFKEFTRRTCHKRFCEKYNDFSFETKLYDGWQYEGLRIMIEEHDLSKLSKEEFIQYRDNFYPISEEVKQQNKNDFDMAWEHHKEENKHHWQSRVNLPHNNSCSGFYNTYLAIENAMDWIAMAYEFNETPLNKYYLNNKDKMQLSEHDKYIIETIYEIMMDKDLDA